MVTLNLFLYSIAIGLVSGYFDYVLTDPISKAAPSWWYRFVDWSKTHTPFKGKPMTCSICMALWLPVTAWGASLLLGCVPLSFSVIFFTGMSFPIALLTSKQLANMDILKL